MRTRCLNPQNQDYKDYGARGITVCERWMDFANFHADMGERPAGLTIERIDVNGNYEPGNCRWADLTAQANNKRNNRTVEWNGVCKTLMQWSREIGIDRSKVRYRLDHGWPVEKAFARQDFRR